MSSSSPPTALALPWFDQRSGGTIADFLRNNKPPEEVLLNFLVNPSPAPRPLTPLTGGGGGGGEYESLAMARPCETSHGPDFSGLLFEGSSIKSEDDAAADDGLNGELIAFDQIDADMARDSFSLFGGAAAVDDSSNGNSHDGIELEVCSPSRSVGAAAAASALLNFPLNNFLAQHGSSFLAAAAAAAAAGVAPDGSELVGFEAAPAEIHAQSCSNLVGDWSLPPDTILLPSSHGGSHGSESNNAGSSSGTNNMVHQYNLQCGSCQILHCIIHSNVQESKTPSLRSTDATGRATTPCCTLGFVWTMDFPPPWSSRLLTPCLFVLCRFPVGNAEYVKQFLLQYSLLRRKEGFVLRHDSTGSFDTGGASGFGIGPDCLNESSASFPKQLGRSLFSDLHSASDTLNAFGKQHLLGPSKANRSSSLDSMDPGDGSNLPVKPPKSNAAAQVSFCRPPAKGMSFSLGKEPASSRCPI
ncbi:uncharacterized protein LOC9663395 isoform X1 [Selaginella moellendorffii]|uniref:uncharacterized protein LOC9663395 isoform X1 n=1 Tax=Selaginella moellendorffii TaxID=88036 RepID=UPI000D1C6F26|nr:uncharacterized protein LOC9663395 isoform X1 [Selaginella moellendorffii]|eukprot:XP_002993553.2 uncharacterized protein LOC9663395 isoform X1 [Selaginella moellendorffii]